MLAKVYGAKGLSNRDAQVALDALQVLVSWRDELQGTFALWRTFATRDTASPTVWMDAYLAAYAAAGKLRWVILGRNFKNLVLQGLDLTLLE